MIPRVKVSVQEDTTNFYSLQIPFVPVVIMKTETGPIGTRELVRSENEFIKKFGKGTENTPVAFAIQTYMRSFSYMYCTRIAGDSAAKGLATIKTLIEEDEVELVKVETEYETSLFNGLEVKLVFETSKAYLTLNLNGITYTSVKEDIPESMKATDLEMILNKLVVSMNSMELGLVFTNLFVDKIVSDDVPEIVEVSATIELGDSGLDNISDEKVLGMLSLYDTTSLNIDVLTIPEFTSAEVVNRAVEIAEDKNFLILASPSSNVLTEALASITNYKKSQGLALYYPNVKYNGLESIIPGCIAALSSYARNDNINKWLAPAGTNRGILPLVKNLALDLSDEKLDTLYNGVVPVNPIKFIDNVGYCVWGQKTTGTQLAYMDRVNIARLVNYVYKEINNISHKYLFEPITNKTFIGWGMEVSALLSSLRSEDAIRDFEYKMDSENNTEATIQANQLIGLVRIKPTEVAEFIDIDFVLTSNI